MGGGQSCLSLWGSFAGEGAAGGGRLGQARVAWSLVAPPWLKPCADAWVGSECGCQGARGDPVPGQTSMVRVEGREGRQPATQLQWGAAPYNLSL